MVMSTDDSKVIACNGTVPSSNRLLNLL